MGTLDKATRKATVSGTLFKAVDFLLKAAIVVMGCGMLGSVVLGVFYRYVLRSPLAWDHEVATYLLVWFTLLGAFYVHLEDGHVR